MTDDPTTGEGTMDWDNLTDKARNLWAQEAGDDEPMPAVIALIAMRLARSERAAGKREGIREAADAVRQYGSGVMLHRRDIVNAILALAGQPEACVVPEPEKNPPTVCCDAPGCVVERPLYASARGVRDDRDHYYCIEHWCGAGQPEAVEKHEKTDRGTAEQDAWALQAARAAPPSEAETLERAAEILVARGLRYESSVTVRSLRDEAAALRAAPQEKREADVFEAFARDVLCDEFGDALTSRVGPMADLAREWFGPWRPFVEEMARCACQNPWAHGASSAGPCGECQPCRARFALRSRAEAGS